MTRYSYFTPLKLAKELGNKATSISGSINVARREIPKTLNTIRELLYSTEVLNNFNLPRQ